MSGRFGQIADDASPETIAKVRALYERPGTPGEKAAAKEALLRFGVDPEKKMQSAGRKEWRVIVGNRKNQRIYSFKVTAASQNEAWSRGLKMVKDEYGAGEWVVIKRP